MTRAQWVVFALTVSLLFVVGMVLHPNDRGGYVLGIVSMTTALIVATLGEKGSR